MEIKEEMIKLFKFKQLIEKSDKSYQELEKDTGIKKSSLQRYATGGTAKIPLKAIEVLAETFNVSQAYLMGWEETPTPTLDKMEITEDEGKLVELFRLVPDEHKPFVLQMIRSAVENLK